MKQLTIKLKAVFFCLALLGAWSLVQAAPPQKVNFQGRLTDLSDNPLNGTYNLTFSLYSALTGGTQMWTETQSGVSIVNGAVDTELGSVTPVPYSAASASAYLEIQVDGETLSPRQPFNSVLYSYNTYQLGGLTAADFVNTSSSQVITGVKIFSANPVFNAGAIPQAAVSGLASSLAGVAADTTTLKSEIDNFAGDNMGDHMAKMDINMYGYSIYSASSVVAGSFYGDGSGLTGVTAAGDNLGSHTATQALNMAGYAITNTSSMTVSGPVLASGFYGDGSGLSNISGDGLGGHVASTNLNMSSYSITNAAAVGAGSLTVGMITASGAVTAMNYYGDGSGLTGISGDNLGSHTATMPLNMGGYGITGVSSMTMAGLAVTGGYFSVANGTAPAVVVQNGNLGLGTAMPGLNATAAYGRIMHVYDNTPGVYPGIFIEDNDIAPGARWFVHGHGDGRNSFAIRDDVNAFEPLYIEGADIGIGTDDYTPMARLHVLSSAPVENIFLASNGPYLSTIPRFVVKGNGNVGLGTEFPAYQFVIDGTTGYAGTMMQISTGGVPVITMAGNGDIYAGRYYGDGSGLTGVTASGDNLGDHTATQQLDMAGYGIANVSSMTVSGGEFSVSGSTLVIRNGKVGIGVQAVARKLAVDGGGAQIGVLSGTNPLEDREGRFEVGGDRGELIMWRRDMVSYPATLAAGDKFSWYSPDSGSMRAFTDVTLDLMAITKTGNVGIGTVVPSYRLVVSSGAGETGTIFAVAVGTANVARINGVGEMYAAKYYGDGSGLTGISGDNLGAHYATMDLNMSSYSFVNVKDMVAFGTATAYAFVGDGSGLSGISGDNLGSHTATQNLNMAGYGIVNVSSFTALGDILAAGNLAIGLSNPVTLTIGNGAGDSFITAPGNQSLTVQATREEGLGSAFAVQTYNAAKNAFVDRFGITGATDTANVSILNSNVGIGTMTPVAKLDVVGNMKITDGTQGAGKFLTSDANGLASWAAAPSDNLGNHVAATALNMAGFTVNNVSTITLAGSGLRISSDTGAGSGIYISALGEIYTLGTGYGTYQPAARGMGSIDLQNRRMLGTDNVAGGNYSTIAGGESNKVLGAADHAFIGAGDRNSVSAGQNGVVAGGYLNALSGSHGFIGGGYNNTVGGAYGTVGGGQYNTANSQMSTIAGGYTNTIDTFSDKSVIFGGSNNSVSNGFYAAAGGFFARSNAYGAFTWADSQGQPLDNNVADRTVFKNRGGFIVTGSTNTNIGPTVNRGVFMSGNGLVGISTGNPQAALDVVSNGGYAQIWRDSGGVIVASMTGNGLLSTSFPAAGDNLGNHTATQALQMGVYAVNSSSHVNAAAYQVNGGIVLAVLPGAGSLGVGGDAGRLNTGAGNSFVGYQAGYSNTTAGGSTFVGDQAGYSNTTGGGHTFVGDLAGYSNTSGEANTFVGGQSGHETTTGMYNSFVGARSGYGNTTGAGNSLMGYYAGYQNQAGSANAIFGNEAGYGASGQSFSSSTLMGYRAGYGITTGSDNTLLGFQAGDNLTTGSRNIVIGYDQNATASTISNELNIGGLIWGRLQEGLIGIGFANTLPQAALDVRSTFTATNAQIWRDETGTAVATMTSSGSLSVSAVNVSGSAQVARHMTQASDAGIVLTSADFGKTVTVNSSSTQTVTLPSVGAGDIGAQVTVIKLGSGSVIIQAAGGTYVADSTSGGTIYNGVPAENYATITLRLATDTRWVILGGNGSWTTN